MTTLPILRPINTDMAVPTRMNNPLDYSPHPLCIFVAKQLQEELLHRDDWRVEIDRGKMFGVLVVRNDHGELFFLAAYSGQILGRSDWDGFVPAVFDYLQPDGFFKLHEAEITKINHSHYMQDRNADDAEFPPSDFRPTRTWPFVQVAVCGRMHIARVSVRSTRHCQQEASVEQP